MGQAIHPSLPNQNHIEGERQIGTVWHEVCI